MMDEMQKPRFRTRVRRKLHDTFIEPSSEEKQKRRVYDREYGKQVDTALHKWAKRTAKKDAEKKFGIYEDKKKSGGKKKTSGKRGKFKVYKGGKAKRQRKRFKQLMSQNPDRIF